MENHLKIFSQDEIIQCLRHIGYIVKEIETYKIYNHYHNQVEYKTCNIFIAYLNNETPDSEILKKDIDSIESKYGLFNVFEKEYKNRIMELFMYKFMYGK